jgi:hypothetical protein
MEQIFVKPAWEGAIVRHPEKLNYVLKQEGEYVNDSIQWQRYLRFGDVVLASPPAQETPAVEKPSKQLNKAGV